MKRRALDEAKKYNVFILESRGEISDFGRTITQEFVRKEISFKDLEKLVRSTTEIVDTYMLENERYIRIGELKTVICRRKHSTLI